MESDIEPHDEDAYVLPRTEALLAATLALMTGHAESDCAQQRAQLAFKIGANLLALSDQAGLSTALRALVWRLHGHWEALEQARALQPLPGQWRSAGRAGVCWQ